ncbi:MAG TPA: hypothetical protein VE866_14390 [Candidatus Binatia bacterium]|nr:hypothetical protein [Candidatus Binatia bacterium]
MLQFDESLVRVKKFDYESCLLADRHYSRQKVGTNQFMPPGKTIVLRSRAGDVVFGWLWQNKRDDGEQGFNCSIFRNESSRQSSEIILEAEKAAVLEWGQNRGFTYIDPDNVSANPGYCFKCAGWRYVRQTTSGLHLLEKMELGT